MTARELTEQSGGFREAPVSAVHWELKNSQLQLLLADSAIEFLGVCSVFLTADAVAQNLTIYEMRIVEENAARIVAEVKFRPGGTLTVNCGGIAVRPDRLA